MHAVLGQRDAAIKEAERPITLLPTKKDAVDGPRMEENLAFVEVLVGDKDGAIPRLQRLLQIPYNNCLTAALLRFIRNGTLCVATPVSKNPFPNLSRNPYPSSLVAGSLNELMFAAIG